MIKAPTYTKSGTKAATAASLPAAVFAVTAANHRLLHEAYRAYQARGRSVSAVALTRGEVRGGGRKPHQQKGTGRARAGSRRQPNWRGGGIIFGPTGKENYHINLSVKAKRVAIRQALSLAATAQKIKVIEAFECPEGKVKPTLALLAKLEANRKVLLVVEQKDQLVERATRNIPSVKAVSAQYLNVFDVLNADSIIISKEALPIIDSWLGAKAAGDAEGQDE